MWSLELMEFVKFGDNIKSLCIRSECRHFCHEWWQNLYQIYLAMNYEQIFQTLVWKYQTE